MDMTEKNGQPSMEEILASIRRIVAEEPDGQMAHPAQGPVIDLRSNPITLNGDGVLDDNSDFDLPAIFRSSAPVVEKPGPLIGRLTDAIRGATAAQPEPRLGASGDDSQQDCAVESSHGSRFGGASASGFPALSSLKSARADGGSETMASVNGKGDGANDGGDSSSSDSAPSHKGWQFSRAAPASPAVNAEIKRVMAPFKDTHFLRMGGAPEGAAPTGPITEAAPPVAREVPQPSSEPSRGVDFSTIIPGHFDRPGASVPPVQPSAPVAQAFMQPEAPAEVAPFFRPGSDTPPASPQSPYEMNASASPALTPPAVPYETATAPRASDPTTMQGRDSSQGDGSVEDATADLLRPMLRQWLADNMPRMVEKALHIEVAESVKSGKKPNIT